VALGIPLLLAFFACYMSALSWADLTYVLPATSLGYVLLALVARFALHEQVSALRWMGIALISGGVGFVAGTPASTHGPEDEDPKSLAAAGRNSAAAPPSTKSTHDAATRSSRLRAASGGDR
jgi:drug/metabolite transporter (DMT)-like permease